MELFHERGNEVLARHDPLGLMEMGTRVDEYASVVAGTLIEFIHGRAATFPAWLRAQLEARFELKPDWIATVSAANDLIALWESPDVAPLRH